MPDLFEGAPCDLANFPPDTPEKKQALSTFFSTKAVPGPNVEKVNRVMDVLAGEFARVERWAVVGYCWGGKVGDCCPERWWEGTLMLWWVGRLQRSRRRRTRSLLPPCNVILRKNPCPDPGLRI